MYVKVDTLEHCCSNHMCTRANEKSPIDMTQHFEITKQWTDLLKKVYILEDGTYLYMWANYFRSLDVNCWSLATDQNVSRFWIWPFYHVMWTMSQFSQYCDFLPHEAVTSLSTIYGHFFIFNLAWLTCIFIFVWQYYNILDLLYSALDFVTDIYK